MKPKTNDPSEGATGFLRIESVVSLNDLDEDDSLDPGAPVVLYSNVTVAKNELTFPYLASHDRPKFAAKLKESGTYMKMLDHVRLKNLFKCMAYRCLFSSNSPNDFSQHLQWHNKHFLTPNPSQPIREHRMVTKIDNPTTCGTLTLPDFYLCSCCPFGARSPAELVEHILGIHGESTFQCPACFFRARSIRMVAIHAILNHPGTKSFSLNCNHVFTTPHEIKSDQLELNQIPRYRCGMNGCGFSSILRDTFIQHMSKNHIGHKEFKCPLCSKDIICTNDDYTQYFLHMNVHSMGFFQCAFCMWGSDLAADALIHLCLYHPSLKGKVLTRSKVDCQKTLVDFWKPGLPHSYSGSHRIDLDGRFKELFTEVTVIQSTLLPEDDVVEMPVAEETPDSVVTKDPENEFHGFGVEEQTKAKEQTVCILVEVEVEEDTTTNQPVDAESSVKENEFLQEGLSGRQLFMCGNIGCDETAETAAAFKVY